MTSRYLVQIVTPTITETIVVADSRKEAEERALGSEGMFRDSWAEDAKIKAVIRLEE